MKDKYEQIPLYGASHFGYKAVIELFLERGMDVAAKDKEGQIPLYIAARHGHEAVVKLPSTKS